MKVLFATYPMAFHTPGGGEIQLLAYRKHLPAHGVDVTLFDQWNPRFLEHDVVHFFSCVGGSVHFCNFVKQLGLPLVVSSSLWVTEETKHLYPIGEIHHQFSLADRVVANSDIECETLARIFDLPREKFVTVLNGVEESFYEPVAPELFRNEFKIHDRFVLNVGNIEPRKNQLALVKAMKSFPELKLVLIGHQRDPEYAKACFAEGGDQLIYAGTLAHDSPALRSAYAACEVFVLPSTLETPGLAALEAHAAGCPAAVTEVGSTREYFGDEVEYLDPSNVDSIVDAIRRAAKPRGSRTTHAAEAHRRHLNWQTVLTQLETTYRSLV
ncbi:glycosyltransferase family 4 protein [Paraburkholderia aspalathi]|uniref:glycosyltransferase family 4 protein n=1 Tax=Paraburkholderia aspalathi TaxID=1324617 RepID=UPI001B1B8DAE|nr:glycosyltransferase family 4 protein [Paraburkholderia aspalathi]CAE6813297.1 D-inositol-3-phosphate glycosyltransferase [Paraburkholderia aspalathi]